MPKPELEFFDSSDILWQHPDGYPDGVFEKVLAWDEEGNVRTRLLRFDPGVVTTRTMIHDYWEEIYIISGGFVVGDRSYTAGMVAVRPPGMPHGPFQTPDGCYSFEVHYNSR